MPHRTAISAQLVSEKKFRLDLFHRLSVFPIVIPPLRQRGEDIVLLADSLLHRVLGSRLGKQLTHGAARSASCCFTTTFPGNVRELRNLIERAVILAPPTGTVGDYAPELLPPRIAEMAVQRQITPSAGAALPVSEPQVSP